MTPAQLDRMRALWEGSPEMTAETIGERFGVSKNAVIGHANRRKWAPRFSYAEAAAKRAARCAAFRARWQSNAVLAATGARR